MIELHASASSAVADTTSSLDAITEAYANGATQTAELLLTQALDLGLPWDQVCTAAARGIAQRYDGHERG
jgi:hypothetical protein